MKHIHIRIRIHNIYENSALKHVKMNTLLLFSKSFGKCYKTRIKC